jgi:hypothetical protein
MREVGVRLRLALIDLAEQPSWLHAAAETAVIQPVACESCIANCGLAMRRIGSWSVE